MLDGTRWSSQPDMPTPRMEFRAVAYKDKLYAIGGRNSNGRLLDVESFDGTAWILEPALPARRENFGLTIFQNLVYVIGGFSGQDVATVETFNATHWSAAPSLLFPRRSFAATAWQDKVYVSAGFADNRGYLADVEVFDGQPLRLERYAHAMVTYQKRMYVVVDRRAFTSIETFDGTSWSQGPGLPIPCQNADAVVYPPED